MSAILWWCVMCPYLETKEIFILQKREVLWLLNIQRDRHLLAQKMTSQVFVVFVLTPPAKNIWNRHTKPFFFNSWTLWFFSRSCIEKKLGIKFAFLKEAPAQILCQGLFSCLHYPILRLYPLLSFTFSISRLISCQVGKICVENCQQFDGFSVMYQLEVPDKNMSADSQACYTAISVTQSPDWKWGHLYVNDSEALHRPECQELQYVVVAQEGNEELEASTQIRIILDGTGKPRSALHFTKVSLQNLICANLHCTLLKFTGNLRHLLLLRRPFAFLSAANSHQTHVQTNLKHFTVSLMSFKDLVMCSFLHSSQSWSEEPAVPALCREQAASRLWVYPRPGGNDREVPVEAGHGERYAYFSQTQTFL